MNYAFWVPNGSPEYRYCLHESVEECNHTMMFQEMVNRIGVDVPGMPRLLKWVQPLIPLVAGPLPIPFWFGILAGEEPIDHTQKNVLREGKSLHPIMEKVMAIHVAEEARHLSFARHYLHDRTPKMGHARRAVLSLAAPLVLGVMARLMVRPPGDLVREFNIPKDVLRAAFDSPEGRQTLADSVTKTRKLWVELGLVGPISRRLWKATGVWGTP
jgi:hypothetical protein